MMHGLIVTGFLKSRPGAEDFLDRLDIPMNDQVLREENT
jgi:hypothetical protein